MKKCNTVFLTTIFPSSEIYLDDFFTSLQIQTSKNFDILIINDGVEDLAYYKKKYDKLNIIEKKGTELPVKNREIGINEVLKLDYKYIIFGDSDDYFSEDRIQKTIESLRKNDLVFNELTLFGENIRKNNILKENIKNLNKINETLFEGNIFGFSNIAIRSEIIKNKIFFDINLIAVDWFFITSILIQSNCRIKFLDDVQTYYRQYDNNTIGLAMQLTEEKLNLGVKVKETHYSALIEYCKKNMLENYTKVFENKLQQILKLKEKLTNDLFKKKYIEHVNLNFKELFKGWWSEIINLETYFKYENKNK